MRRLNERRASYAKQLEEEQPEADTIKLRARIAELDDIARIPKSDRLAHADTLKFKS